MSNRCRAATLALLATLLLPASGLARPLYFDNFTAFYGFTSGDDLYACGVCHRRWEGTGGRNPYGQIIEQQLYLGKPILEAIADVESLDTDLDGFTNVDELTVHGTLPGYSCDNFTLVINPPPNFQSLIEPGVASCLEPQDILVEPLEIPFIVKVGEQQSVPIALVNNGTDFPIAVSSVALLPGAPATLSLDSAPFPIVIPVGSTAIVDLVFAPTSSIATNATVRITSDDPDEPTIDVDVTLFAFVQPLAPAEDRAACLRVVERQFRRYSKRHFKEWGDCYLDELSGRACDGGRRDLRIMRAEEKLRRSVGGDRDHDCAGNGLSPTLLGMPATCGGACDGIALTSITRYADCLVCRQNASAGSMLTAATGTAPPDLPSTTVSGQALKCQTRLLSGTETAIRKLLEILARCELGNVTAATPADCQSSNAAAIATILDRVNARLDRCSDTTGLAGCLFQTTPDPTCLGDEALAIGSSLTDAIFGLDGN